MKLLHWVLGLLVLLTASCKVEFDESMPFYCQDDSDCGGDGYVCVKPSGGGSSYCCKDEGFFDNDSNNCGQCGNVCTAGKKCISGVCG
jgi:hypothetical protein